MDPVSLIAIVPVALWSCPTTTSPSVTASARGPLVAAGGGAVVSGLASALGAGSVAADVEVDASLRLHPRLPAPRQQVANRTFHDGAEKADANRRDFVRTRASCMRHAALLFVTASRAGRVGLLSDVEFLTHVGLTLLA